MVGLNGTKLSCKQVTNPVLTLPKIATCHPMIDWDLLKGVADIEFMQRGAQLDLNIENKTM